MQVNDTGYGIKVTFFSLSWCLILALSIVISSFQLLLTWQSYHSRVFCPRAYYDSFWSRFLLLLYFKCCSTPHLIAGTSQILFYTLCEIINIILVIRSHTLWSRVHALFTVLLFYLISLTLGWHYKCWITKESKTRSTEARLLTPTMNFD